MLSDRRFQQARVDDTVIKGFLLSQVSYRNASRLIAISSQIRKASLSTRIIHLAVSWNLNIQDPMLHSNFLRTLCNSSLKI